MLAAIISWFRDIVVDDLPDNYERRRMMINYEMRDSQGE